MWKRLIRHGLSCCGHYSVASQQDNDHNTHIQILYKLFAKKEACRELKIMTWPAQSPDLNPIELIWGQLDHEVQKECLINISFVVNFTTSVE